ncbi:MAG: hypothetical protein ACRC6G_06605 [Deefgea sp.]
MFDGVFDGVAVTSSTGQPQQWWRRRQQRQHLVASADPHIVKRTVTSPTGQLVAAAAMAAATAATPTLGLFDGVFDGVAVTSSTGQPQQWWRRLQRRQYLVASAHPHIVKRTSGNEVIGGDGSDGNTWLPRQTHTLLNALMETKRSAHLSVVFCVRRERDRGPYK